MFGDISGNGLGARSGIAFQGADGGMARSRKQDRGIGPILGGMRQCGMSQLMERQIRIGLVEELRSPTIRQPGSSSDRAAVDARHCPRRPAIGQKYWAARAAGE